MSINIQWNNKEFAKATVAGDAIRDIAREKIERTKAEAEARFLQDFGVAGTFDIEVGYTKGKNKYGTNRVKVRLRAGDAKTAAILKNNTRWLDYFL